MQSKVYAYVRVSTEVQNLDRQYIAIKEYATKNGLALDERDIIADKQSGKNFDRDGWQLLLRLLRPSDYLIIKELDRLGRDYEAIKDTWHYLSKNDINLVVIDNPLLNTANRSDIERSLISNIIFELLSYIAASERTKILQRQKEGIYAAKAKGVRFGRPRLCEPDNYFSVYQMWQKGEISAQKAMRLTNLKKSSFYRFATKYKI